LVLIDDLEARITQIAKELRRSGADHRYIPLLLTAPGFGSITSFTVACELGDIARFACRSSSPATPGCVRASSSQARATTAARCPSTAPAVCAGG
jgi:hypothetical protein